MDITRQQIKKLIGKMFSLHRDNEKLLIEAKEIAEMAD